MKYEHELGSCLYRHAVDQGRISPFNDLLPGIKYENKLGFAHNMRTHRLLGRIDHCRHRHQILDQGFSPDGGLV